MRLIPQLVAFAVATAVGASVMPTLAAAASVPPTVPIVSVDPSGDGLRIDIVPESAGRVVPGSDLTVTITIANASTERIPAGTAEVFIGATPADDREELASWLDGDADDATLGAAAARVDTPAVVAGGSARLPPVTIPAAALPFPPGTAFGVHRLTARASAGVGTATGNTAVTVNPGTATPITRLALAMPIAVPTEAGGVISESLLEQYTAEGGVLSRQLDEAQARPIAVGIDPRIIASIRLLGQTAPASALEWLEQLEQLPNETFPLSYADTDIAATSQAGAGVLAPTTIEIDPARFPADQQAPGDDGSVEDDTGEDGSEGDGTKGDGAENGGTTDDGTEESGDTADDPTPTPSGEPGEDEQPQLPTLASLLEWDYTTTTIAWPRDRTVVASDLDTFAAAGLTTTVVSSGNAGDPASATASAADHDLLVSDDTVSSLLRDAVGAPSFSEWQSAMARLTAAIALLSDGAGDRVTLATLDRRGPADGYQLAATLGVLAGLPWATPAALGDALAQSPVSTSLVDAPVGDERLAALGGMIGIEGSIAQFATVADEPTLVTGERRLALLALAAQAWTTTGETWTEAVSEFQQRSREILASVQVESTVLAQWSDNGDLPLVISNSLPYPVTVNVNVRASSAILDITEPNVRLTVPGDSQKRALIPVESIANGEVRLVVTLTSIVGIGIAAPASVAVTVNAGWETAATVVLAILVVGVFVLGVIRTIRRRRRLARENDPEPNDRESTDAAALAASGDGGAASSDAPVPRNEPRE